MAKISEIRLKASNTFPLGITITQFKYDIYLEDIAPSQTTFSRTSPNGEIITWSKPRPIEIQLDLIADGNDDKNLAILFEANRIGKNKMSAQDIITLTLKDINDKLLTLQNGILNKKERSSYSIIFGSAN